MVHRRQVGGQEIVLGNQGALWGNAMTWWDHDTGSIWSQPLGEAILGPRTGERLDLLPSKLTSWGSWKTAHPDTLALNAHGGYSGFSLDQMALVVDFDTEVAAYMVVPLRGVGVVNDVVAGAPLAVVVDPASTDGWAVFSRRLEETIVELSMHEGVLLDVASGTSFDPVRGIGKGGELDGAILDRLPAFTSFPEDVLTFWPEARFWSG